MAADDFKVNSLPEDIIQKRELKPTISVNPFLSFPRVNSHTITQASRMTREDTKTARDELWVNVTPERIEAVGKMTHEEWWASLSDEVKKSLDYRNGVIGDGESLVNLDGEGRLYLELSAPIREAEHQEFLRVIAEKTALGEKMGLTLASITKVFYEYEISLFTDPNGGQGKIMVRFEDGRVLWKDVPADYRVEDFRLLTTATINLLLEENALSSTVSSSRLYEIFDELFTRLFK
jgi:hypothetical protein